MEIILSLDKYTIMEQVSKQASAFRMADMYHLLKKLEPEKWQAKDVKITLEWLADMGLAKRKLLNGGIDKNCCFTRHAMIMNFYSAVQNSFVIWKL